MSTETSANILICCTGSVAALKIPELTDILKTRLPRCSIEIACTENCLHFLEDWSKSFSGKIHKDEDQWTMWNKMGDPVLHIELVKWADLMIMAPLDANTLAKLANGICDNLVTVIPRAWDFASKKPVLFCPAMNTKMYLHPVTAPQIKTLESWGFTLVQPITKLLACGDEGIGGMAEVSTIAEAACKILV